MDKTTSFSSYLHSAWWKDMKRNSVSKQTVQILHTNLYFTRNVKNSTCILTYPLKITFRNKELQHRLHNSLFTLTVLQTTSTSGPNVIVPCKMFREFMEKYNRFIIVSTKWCCAPSCTVPWYSADHTSWPLQHTTYWHTDSHLFYTLLQHNSAPVRRMSQMRLEETF